MILFRPTVSPIVYQQQIGRALVAGKNSAPVIFDIVNNIENLYSIGSVTEEMRVAIQYYRCLGMDWKTVNERFGVTDELKECRELFEKLNDTLTSSWDTMYASVCAFYKEHGHLDVPNDCVTADGRKLGIWITNQRQEDVIPTNMQVQN